MMALALLAGCSSSPPETVRVCRGAACAQESRTTETFRPADPAPLPREVQPLLAAAEGGDPQAQTDLGLNYMSGAGVPQDGFEGMRWLRKASEQGAAKAQLALGRIYLSGYDTVGQDLNEAQRWLGAAAAQGDPEAKKLLAEAKTAEAESDRYAYWRARPFAWPYLYRYGYYGRYWRPHGYGWHY
jgi:TPR repeat protein